MNFVGFGSHVKYRWSCGEHDWTKSPYHMMLTPYCVECHKNQKQRDKAVKDELLRKSKEEREQKNRLKRTRPKAVPKKRLRKKYSYPSTNSGIFSSEFKEAVEGHLSEVSRDGKRKTSYDTSRGIYSIPLNQKDSLEIYPDLTSQWSERNDRIPREVSSSSKYHAWWKCINGHEWQAYVYYRTQHYPQYGNACPICRGNQSSILEKELSDFIESSTSQRILLHDRSLIGPKELDIYLPDSRIAIEFNGVYWHSERGGKGKWFHFEKWKLCRDKGVQLITIWEDDWLYKNNIVKNMILHKIGASEQEKIYARSCQVVQISQSVANGFLDNHHIQGKANGSIRLALQNKNNEIVAVSVWRRITEDTWLLSRYATSSIVVGGMSKMISHFERLKKQGVIVTFADHEVSDGSSYKGLGFVKDRTLHPDYKYVFNRVRNHKSRFRKSRFKSDPSLVFDESMTESELAILNKIDRVWDSGKARYVKMFDLT